MLSHLFFQVKVFENKQDFVKNNCKDLRFLALNINEGNNTISTFFSELRYSLKKIILFNPV